MYFPGYELKDGAGEIIAIFVEYREDGQELWEDANGITAKTFEGFTPNGDVIWSMSIEDFYAPAEHSEKKVLH
jgi:hypothetical protein